MEAGSLPVSSGTRVAVTCTYSWGTGGGTLFVDVSSALIWLKPLRRAVRQSQAKPAARHPARLMSAIGSRKLLNEPTNLTDVRAKSSGQDTQLSGKSKRDWGRIEASEVTLRSPAASPP